MVKAKYGYELDGRPSTKLQKKQRTARVRARIRKDKKL